MSSAYPPGQTHGHPARAMHQVSRALCTIDVLAEVAQLRAEESWQQGTRNAKTVVKEPDLRVVVIVLRRGARMEAHRAPARLCMQTLTGRLRLHVLNQTIDLAAGQILLLDPEVAHDVEALEESAFLLTMAWPTPMSPRPASERRA